MNIYEIYANIFDPTNKISKITKAETKLLIHHHCIQASKVWILPHFFTGLLFTNNSHDHWKSAPKFKLWMLGHSDNEKVT